MITIPLLVVLMAFTGCVSGPSPYYGGGWLKRGIQGAAIGAGIGYLADGKKGALRGAAGGGAGGALIGVVEELVRGRSAYSYGPIGLRDYPTYNYPPPPPPYSYQGGGMVVQPRPAPPRGHTVYYGNSGRSQGQPRSGQPAYQTSREWAKTQREWAYTEQEWARAERERARAAQEWYNGRYRYGYYGRWRHRHWSLRDWLFH